MSTSVQSLRGPDIATRIAAFDYSLLGELLPNPDPLLKELGQDIRVYRDLMRESHVGSCIRRRKAAVLALEWGLSSASAGKRITASVQSMLDGLDMERIIRQALDAPQMGYQPMEVTWWGAGSGLWLSDIQAKPPEWFCFDADARLRFKTKSAPMYGVELPDYKFLLPRQDASYQNPYGFPDLALCYWPVVFMKGGKRFWLTFCEKFGGTFLVGKLPRTAQDEERRAMLEALEMLVQDGVGTIPDDGSVAPLESGSKSASSDLYEKLVMFCRSEISIAQTGTNQTMEASSTHASAKAGMGVVEDLRDADAAIVCAMMNQAIRWVVDKNYPGQSAPVFEMWDQRARDELRAARDKQLSDAGAKFTNRYWVRSYGYKEDDLQPEAGTTPPPPAPTPPALQASDGVASFAQGDAASTAEAPDPLASDLATLTTAAAPAWATLVDKVQAVVMQAGSLADAQQALLAAYGHLPTDELTRLMAAAFALAELKGMAAALEDGAA